MEIKKTSEKQRLIRYLKTLPRKQVEEIIKDLPSQMYKVMYGRFIERKKVFEIADEIHLSEAQVKDRTKQACNIILKTFNNF